MTIFLTIIAVAVIFSVLVLIHEYGHFIAARRAGIRVIEFGIGFPPRLFKKKIGETLYTINAIPFGGFVKLYGEDATDEKTAKDKESFANKSPWTRTKVIVAGVFMNFLLAIALLTVGFSFGIEPLLVTENDLFDNLESGVVKSQPGVFIARVGSQTSDFGIRAGDQILSIDDKPIKDLSQLAVLEKGKAVKDIDVTVRHKDGVETSVHLPLTGKDFGIGFRPITDFPRLSISEIREDSSSARAGLRAGDSILKMNGREIYSPADFGDAISGATSVAFEVLRGNRTLEVSVSFSDQRRVVITDIFEASAAALAGFQKGDIVISIDDHLIADPEQMQRILKQNPDREMAYKLLRNDQELVLRSRTGENKMLGVALSVITSFRNSDISFYRDSVLTSITEIKKVRYNPWISFKKAVSETVRLTGLTVGAFGRTIGSIFSRFAVPEDIGGPVQIAYYTHTFVKEGFFALLRFTALLSLSLAVINVLPIPALDGGRLLFIIIEVVARKRVNARIEAFVHMVGFILLLLLIAFVTFSDITKLF